MKQINQQELKEIFQNEQGIQIETLYQNYHKLIYGICYSILKNTEDSQDVMQLVFIKLLQLPKEKLPTTNEASWLYTVTKHEALSYIRGKKKTVSIEEVILPIANETPIEEIEDKDSFEKAIQGLNEKEKEVVSLKILCNLTFKEIGEMLEIPTATAQWRYYKALHTLKLLFTNMGMFIVSLFTYRLVTKKTKQESTNTIQQNTVEENEGIANDKLKNEIDMESSKQDNTIQEVENKPITLQPEKEVTYDVLENGILGLCTIFLIISLIFFIIFLKHQQNKKRKSSK